MRTPPVVDDLWSRALEARQVTRSFVKQARVVDMTAAGVTLATNAAVRNAVRWHYDAADRETRGDDGEIDGTVSVEIVGDGVVRVRYAEGGHIGERSLPMVVGVPDPAPTTSIDQGADVVTLTAGATRVEITLRPFSVSINNCVAIGGREKNHFSAWDAYNTGISRTDDGRPIATECFAIRSQEAIYGFGERFTALNKVGQTVDLVAVEGTGTSTSRAYKNIPFWVSTAGYGVFLNTTARVTAWVGSHSTCDLQVGIEEDVLDYYVFLGDIPTVLDRYTTLTGRPVVPPDWTFGWWQSKISYSSAAEGSDVVARLRAAGVPLDVLHLDTHWYRHDWQCDLEFDPDRFPDPAGWMAELRSEGVRVCLWQLPYIPNGSALFDEIDAVGGFVGHPDGGVYDVGLSWTPGFQGVVGCIDFTNPHAIVVYQRHLRRLLEAGASAIKVDFGEQAPIDGVYHDGTPGHLVHNVYPLLYNRAVAEITEQITGERIIWARSAWAGSQRYPLHWGGDSSSNWDSFRTQLLGGLSFGLSGFAFWSQDIGGFLGQPDGALLIRWVQAGVLLSHARIHGTGVRELDRFDPDVLDVCRHWIRFRYRLLPYLLASAHDAVARSVPTARALVVDFQDDPTTWPIGDQWMLGPHLLVAPILDETGRRRVYLPRGQSWHDWWSGERFDGGQWIDVTSPIDQIPLWVREGGIVPMGPDQLHVGQVPTNHLTIRAAPFDGDGTTVLVVPIDGRMEEVVHRSVGGVAELTNLGATSITVAWGP